MEATTDAECMRRATMRPGRLARVSMVVGLVGLLAACGWPQDLLPAGVPAPTAEEVSTMVLQITSPAFADGTAIPARYTCTGDDLSPALAWSGAPPGTVSFALIMDDPDAPGQTWVHWVVYNLPAEAVGLPEGITANTALPGGALQGRNSWRRNDYGGPCPPSGTHRYYFKLYALDTTLPLGPGATKAEVLAALEGHVLVEAQLMGTYRK